MAVLLLLLGCSPAALALKTAGRTRPPKLAREVPAVYPSQARMHKVRGVVHLRIMVGADGRVGAVEVVEGHLLLRDAAKDAVKQWRYSPAMVNGEPVAVPLEVTVRFPPR